MGLQHKPGLFGRVGRPRRRHPDAAAFTSDRGRGSVQWPVLSRTGVPLFLSDRDETLRGMHVGDGTKLTDC